MQMSSHTVLSLQINKLINQKENKLWNEWTEKHTKIKIWTIEQK
jgi:hypothetical protein